MNNQHTTAKIEKEGGNTMTENTPSVKAMLRNQLDLLTTQSLTAASQNDVIGLCKLTMAMIMTTDMLFKSPKEE